MTHRAVATVALAIAAFCADASGEPAPATPPATQPAAASRPSTPIVVSTWTDVDVQAAVAALSRELLSARWQASVRARLRRAPRIELREIRNRSSEHLNTDFLRSELARALVRGGLKLSWRPSTEVYSAATASAPCPDLVLEGGLVSMNDASDGSELRSHLLSLWLLELAGGEKLWMGTFQVRKLVERTVRKDGSEKVEVTRLGASRVVDLSGQPNDSDAAEIVRAAVADLLKSQLLRSGPRPVLRFERLRNRSSYHLSTQYITAQIEAALIRSGKARVVASVEESSLDESPARCRKGRKPLEASHQIGGTFLSQEEQGVDQRVRYQVELEAVSTGTNDKAWMLVKSISKIISRRTSW